jgi:hypothetical protein
MANGILKDPSFHTDFQNESAVFVKSAPQKFFAKKLLCGLKNRPNPRKIGFWAKVKGTFLNQ